jgi:hypothetical protein
MLLSPVMLGLLSEVNTPAMVNKPQQWNPPESASIIQVQNLPSKSAVGFARSHRGETA